MWPHCPLLPHPTTEPTYPPPQAERRESQHILDKKTKQPILDEESGTHKVKGPPKWPISGREVSVKWQGRLGVVLGKGRAWHDEEIRKVDEKIDALVKEEAKAEVTALLVTFNSTDADLFDDGSRVVFRLSGTGVAGATIRMYLEKYVPPTGDLAMHAFDVVKPLGEIGLALSGLEAATGRTAPDVIT